MKCKHWAEIAVRDRLDGYFDYEINVVLKQLNYELLMTTRATFGLWSTRHYGGFTSGMIGLRSSMYGVPAVWHSLDQWQGIDVDAPFRDDRNPIYPDEVVDVLINFQ